MTLRLFAVAEAYYYYDRDNMIEIAGVPEYDRAYYGEYTGVYPYQGASKAFTGLQKHMKKFYKTGDWFPGYDPENPPMIIFKLVDVANKEANWYEGRRVPHHQGAREVVNASDGRVRKYRWDNKVVKISNPEPEPETRMGSQELEFEDDSDFDPMDLLD